MTVHSVESPERPGSDAETVLTFPCSAAQRRFYFVDAMSPNDPALNVALRWEIRGPLASATIERAFSVIIDRHESLRTRIIERDGTPVQEVVPRLRVKPSEIDLTALPPSRRESEASRLGQLEAQKPFDLAALPLLRVTVLRLAADRSLLLITIHHIAFDAWSIRLLSREFGTIAAALDAGTQPSLPDLPMQYGDYAKWEQAYLASRASEQDDDYWCRQLAGAPYVEVPGDRERPSSPTHNSDIAAVLLPEAVGKAWSRALKQHNTTQFAFACASVAAILHRHTGLADICMGTQVSGRDDPDLENLIGPFVNNLVLRFDASGDPSIAQYLDRVRRTIQDAISHRMTPFDTLVKLLKPSRDARRTPLVSVNFTMLQDVTEDARYGSFELSGSPSLSAGRLHDLNFFMVRWPAIGWRMAVEYDADLFDRATAERLVAAWADMFRSFIDEPQSRPFPFSRAAHPGRPAEASRPARPLPTIVAPLEPARTRTQTQGDLLDLWKEVLGVDSIDLESNFFECGGHSLLALRMLSEVAARFGRRVGISALLTAPTAREFADRIAMGVPELETWNVVPIQPEGSQIPIIAINNTLIYHNLAKIIGPERPFYSVQLFDPKVPDDLPPRGFEQIVSDYVRLIRAARPHGPYILFGLCIAGTIAYEAAQQLRRAGEAVPLVVMADTLRPGYMAQLPPLRAFLCRAAYRWHVAKHQLRALWDREASLSSVLHSYSLVRRSGVFHLAGLNDQRRLGREDWGNRWFLPHLERARADYVPQPTGDTLIVIASDELGPIFAERSLGWGPLAEGGIVCRHVPGWHAAMFGASGSERIAASLRPLLRRIDGIELLGGRGGSMAQPPGSSSVSPAAVGGR